MGTYHQAQASRRPVVDLDFLQKFVPYELLLAQRRAMVLGTSRAKEFPNAYIGLYVIRLEPLPSQRQRETGQKWLP